MNALLHWLTAPEWALVVKALLHSLWQGALIAGGIALLLRRLRNPATRYRLALAGLGAVIVSGITTWAVLNAPSSHAPEIAVAPPQTVEPLSAPTGPVERIVVVAERTPATPALQWTAWLALAWLIGASVMLGRASVKVAGAEQLRRSCRPLDDDQIAMLVAEAKRAVNLTRQIRVAVTDQLTSPAVVGVLVPTLILPLSLLTTLTPEQIRFVLLHELAHIRRGDYLANLFQLFAEALLFFNPAVWWLSHQVRREREACCDALAIELSGAPADYARTLVSVAETMLNPSPAAAPAFGNEREPSSLADRVQRLLVPGYRPSLRLTWRAMLAALVTGGVLLGLLAAGARETVAATTVLREPNAASTNSLAESVSVSKSAASSAANTAESRTIGINPATGLPEGEATRVNPATGLANFAPSSEPALNTGVSFTSSSAAFDPANRTLTLKGNVLMTNAGMILTGDEVQVVLPSTPTSTGVTSNAPGANRTAATNLYTRTFKVEANVFAKSLEAAAPTAKTNLTQGLRDFLATLGVDLHPPKTIFFNDRNGTLLVRASLADLDLVEQSIQVMTLAPPQVNIRARFVEVPANNQVGRLLEGLLPATTNLVIGGNARTVLTNGFAGILTAQQAKTVLKALEQAEGVEILSTPGVTTLSGRQAQIQMVDYRTIVTGAVPLVTNGISTNVLQTSALPFGPTLDVIPYVSADGYTVQMTVIPTITEFLGYEKPDAALTEYARTNSLSAALPLPHFRVRQLTTSAVVWDGQTIVLGGFLSEMVTRRPDGSETRKPDSQEQKKQLLVFITPTIIDPAGNPVHGNSTKPFPQNTIPPQQALPTEEQKIFDRYDGPKPLPGEKAFSK